MATGRLNAVGEFVEADADKMYNGGAGFFVKSVSFVGTISFYITDEAGTKWPLGVYSYASDDPATSVTGDFAGYRNLVGAKKVRAECTAYTSGDADVEVNTKAG